MSTEDIRAAAMPHCGHVWFVPEDNGYPHITGGHESCRKCGVIRRADDKNSPCRGIVKVTLR